MKRKISNFAVPAAAVTVQTMGIDYLAATLLGIVPGTIKNSSLFFNDTNVFKDYILNEWLLNPGNVINNAAGNDLFVKAQIPLLAYYAYKLGKIAWNNRSHKLEDGSNYGAFGTAREATKEEILDKEDFTTDINQEGTLLAKYGKKPLIQHNKSRLNRNVSIFGGSGSGKTEGYIIPNILNTKNKSIVVTDPKGELYERTAETKRKQGYKVHLLNFTDMSISDRYNPLDYIKEEIDIRRMAFTLAANNQKQDFWNDATISLVSALIAYVKFVLPKEQQHMKSVFNMLKLDEETLERLFMDLPDDHIAKDSYIQAVKHLEGKTRSGVFISTSVLLDLWKYKKVSDFTYTSDFKLKDLGREKIIVYIILPVAENQFRPISSMFFNQLFQELYSLADKNNNKLPNKVRIMLDEFANIGKIPNFTERLATTRSYGIEVSIIIQSVGQLRNLYGMEETDNIISNCDFRLFLGGNAPDSAEYFAKMLGTTTKLIQSQSESKNDKGGSHGENYSYTSRQLRTPDELLRLDPKRKEAVLLVKGKQPMFVTKAFWNEFKAFRTLSEPQINRSDYQAASRSEYHVFEPSSVMKEEQSAVKEKINLDKKLDEKPIIAAPTIEQLLAETAAEIPESNDNTDSKKEEEGAFIGF